jgi:hypothetical protein
MSFLFCVVGFTFFMQQADSFLLACLSFFFLSAYSSGSTSASAALDQGDQDF